MSLPVGKGSYPIDLRLPDYGYPVGSDSRSGEFAPRTAQSRRRPPGYRVLGAASSRPSQHGERAMVAWQVARPYRSSFTRSMRHSCSSVPSRFVKWMQGDGPGGRHRDHPLRHPHLRTVPASPRVVCVLFEWTVSGRKLTGEREYTLRFICVTSRRATRCTWVARLLYERKVSWVSRPSSGSRANSS